MHTTFNHKTRLLLGALLVLMTCLSTAEAQQRNRKQFHAAEARILGQLVYTDITAEFNNTELRTVMEFFKSYTGTPMVIKWMKDDNAEGLNPELLILQNRADAENIVIAADDPERAIRLQNAPRRFQPVMGKQVICVHRVELIPILGHTVDDGIIRTREIAAEL